MVNEIKSKLDGTQYNSFSEHVHLYNNTLKSIPYKKAPIKNPMQNLHTTSTLVQQRHSHCTEEKMQIRKTIPS